MEHKTLKLPKLNFSKEVINYYPEILTEDALNFMAALHEKFNASRLSLLEKRLKQQKFFDEANLPEFPQETKSIRESDWTAANIPEDLKDRRVEITGPVDRKMIINALNSGARTFMADMENSTATIWKNVIEGHQNLNRVWRRHYKKTPSLNSL